MLRLTSGRARNPERLRSLAANIISLDERPDDERNRLPIAAIRAAHRALKAFDVSDACSYLSFAYEHTEGSPSAHLRAAYAALVDSADIRAARDRSGLALLELMAGLA